MRELRFKLFSHPSAAQAPPWVHLSNQQDKKVYSVPTIIPCWRVSRKFFIGLAQKEATTVIHIKLHRHHPKMLGSSFTLLEQSFSDSPEILPANERAVRVGLLFQNQKELRLHTPYKRPRAPVVPPGLKFVDSERQRTVQSFTSTSK